MHCGINRRRIRVELAPQGLGAGEQYVREQYPTEVQSYRSQCQHLNIALVVIIDADQNSVSERHHQLDRSLTEHGLSKRGPEERIGLFVPRRNIETWIHYLQGKSVNEVDKYPKLSREGECKPFVADLAQNRHQPLPVEAPASLRAACDELDRIP